MEAFSKFGGDLDPATKVIIDKGARNVEIHETSPVFTI
jgi:F-type H+-transporting ATPase subunit alpha